MTAIYLFALSLGFVFTVVGSVFGHFVLEAGGDGEGGLDGASVGHDYGVTGVDGDAGGHGDAEGTEATGLHLPLLSPAVLSCYVACFGGSGLIYQHLFGEERLWVHFPLAGLTGLALGVAVAFGMWKLTTTFSRNRLARESDALGALAEVSISIPVKGVGEVAYVSGGTRQTAMARSEDGFEHRQGSEVRVTRMVDGTAFVTRAPALQPVAVVSMNEEPRASGEPVRVRRK